MSYTTPSSRDNPEYVFTKNSYGKRIMCKKCGTQYARGGTTYCYSCKSNLSCGVCHREQKFLYEGKCKSCATVYEEPQKTCNHCECDIDSGEYCEACFVFLIGEQKTKETVIITKKETETMNSSTDSAYKALRKERRNANIAKAKKALWGREGKIFFAVVFVAAVYKARKRLVRIWLIAKKNAKQLIEEVRAEIEKETSSTRVTTAPVVEATVETPTESE